MKFKEMSLASCKDLDPVLITLFMKAVEDAIEDYQHLACFDVDYCLEEVHGFVDAAILLLGTLYPEAHTLQYIITFDEQQTQFRFNALNTITTGMCHTINQINRNTMVTYQ